MRLPGRIDTLLALPSGLIVALVGAPTSTIRFLPHDTLLILPPGGTPQRIPLPPYVAAPGLATDASSPVAVLVDNRLLLLDARSGRLLARRPLDMAAVGWPAAIAAIAGRLYLAGQPANAMAARLEAFALGPSARTRLLWRTPLGLTHAGIWLGAAGPSLLADYQPDAHDAQGDMTLRDTRTGAARASYAVQMPPVAADPGRGVLLLVSGGRIRALTLANGGPLASAFGALPLALDPVHGLVAYAWGGSLVLAVTRTLRPLARLPLSGITALAFTPDGATLLVGQGTRLIKIPAGIP